VERIAAFAAQFAASSKGVLHKEKQSAIAACFFYPLISSASELALVFGNKKKASHSTGFSL